MRRRQSVKWGEKQTGEFVTRISRSDHGVKLGEVGKASEKSCVDASVLCPARPELCMIFYFLEPQSDIAPHAPPITFHSI